MSQRFGPYVVNYDAIDPVDAAGDVVTIVVGAADDYRAGNPAAPDPLPIRIDLTASVDEGQTEGVEAADVREALAARILEEAASHPGLAIAICDDAPELSDDENEYVGGNAGSITAWYLVFAG